MVAESTPGSKVNITQLVGAEDGTVLVPTYNWQEFVNPAYRQLLGIKPMGHLFPCQLSPGGDVFSVFSA